VHEQASIHKSGTHNFPDPQGISISISLICSEGLRPLSCLDFVCAPLKVTKRNYVEHLELPYCIRRRFQCQASRVLDYKTSLKSYILGRTASNPACMPNSWQQVARKHLVYRLRGGSSPQLDSQPVGQLSGLSLWPRGNKFIPLDKPQKSGANLASPSWHQSRKQANLAFGKE